MDAVAKDDDRPGPLLTAAPRAVTCWWSWTDLPPHRHTWTSLMPCMGRLVSIPMTGEEGGPAPMALKPTIRIAIQGAHCELAW